MRIRIIMMIIIIVVVIYIITKILTQRIQYKLIPDLEEYTKTTRKNPDVDVVITWVDSTDIQWKQAKIEAQKKEGRKLDSIRVPPSLMVDAELSLNLLLIFKNIPWIRNVFIVSWRITDIPCLSENAILNSHYKSGRIKLINQKDILPEPINVFNSHAIESRLHYIPGLSEKFLYMNDDFFVTRFIPYDMLFYKDLPVIRPQFYLPASSYLTNIYFKWMPGYKIIQDYFQKYKIFFPSHHVTPLTKTMMLDAEYTLKKEWDATTRSVFRSHKDIAPVAFSLLNAIPNHKVIGFKKDPLITFYNLHANRHGEYEDRFVYMFLQILPSIQDKLTIRNYKRILYKLNKIQPHCVCFSALKGDDKLDRTLKAISQYAFSR